MFLPVAVAPLFFRGGWPFGRSTCLPLPGWRLALSYYAVGLVGTCDKCSPWHLSYEPPLPIAVAYTHLTLPTTLPVWQFASEP